MQDLALPMQTDPSKKNLSRTKCTDALSDNSKSLFTMLTGRATMQSGKAAKQIRLLQCHITKVCALLLSDIQVRVYDSSEEPSDLNSEFQCAADISTSNKDRTANVIEASYLVISMHQVRLASGD